MVWSDVMKTVFCGEIDMKLLKHQPEMYLTSCMRSSLSLVQIERSSAKARICVLLSLSLSRSCKSGSIARMNLRGEMVSPCFTPLEVSYFFVRPDGMIPCAVVLLSKMSSRSCDSLSSPMREYDLESKSGSMESKAFFKSIENI